MDRWLSGTSVEEIAADVFHSVCPISQAKRRVADALVNNSWVKDIRKQINFRVIMQILGPWEILSDIELSPNRRDTWKWFWEPERCFLRKISL